MSSGASRLAPVLRTPCRTATSSPVRLAGSKPIIAAFVTVAVVNFIAFPPGEFTCRFWWLFSFSPEFVISLCSGVGDNKAQAECHKSPRWNTAFGSTSDGRFLPGFFSICHSERSEESLRYYILYYSAIDLQLVCSVIRNVILWQLFRYRLSHGLRMLFCSASFFC